MSWPALTIKLDPETGAELLIAGIAHKQIPPGSNVRALAMQEAQALAATYRRTIPVTCIEPETTFELSVDQDGTITDLTNPKTKRKHQPKDAPPPTEIPSIEPEILTLKDPLELEEDLPLVQVPDFYHSEQVTSLDQTLTPQDLDTPGPPPGPEEPTTPNTVNAVETVNAGVDETAHNPDKPAQPETAETHQIHDERSPTTLPATPDQPHPAKTVNAGDTVKTGIDVSEDSVSQEPQETIEINESDEQATDTPDHETHAVNTVNAGDTVNAGESNQVPVDQAPTIVGWYDLGRDLDAEQPVELKTTHAIETLDLGKYPSIRDFQEDGEVVQDVSIKKAQFPGSRKILVAAGVTLAVAVLAAGGWWATSTYQDSQLASAQSQFITSAQSFGIDSSHAKESLEQGRSVLESIDEAIVGDDLVGALRSGVQELAILVESPRVAQPGQDRDTLVAATLDVDARAAVLTDASDTVDQTVAQIHQVVTVWELAQALEANSDASTNLTTAITNAEQTAKDLAGKVADNKTIDGLKQAVRDARTGLDANVEQATAETVAVGTAVLVKGAESLATAIKAATDSNAAWVEAEEAKKAVAEKAAAEKVAPPKTPAQPKPSAKPNTGSTQGPAKKPAPKAPAAKPKPATPKPAPKPAAGSISGLSTTVATSGGGKATVTVTVKGSGSGTVSITVAGKSTSVSVNAPGTYSKTLTGLTTGKQSWSTSVAGMTNSGSLTIY